MRYLVAPHEQTEFAPDDTMRPSKSQRKRDSDALQSLGEELLALSAERLSKIAMSDNLREALREAQRLTRHEARRRQLQYIGKLMRSEDPVPLRAALDAINGVSAAANAHMHRLERLRERLLEDEAGALAEITAAHPRADLQHLRQLRRNAIREKEQNRPPRAFREIFQVLKALAEAKNEEDKEGNQEA